MLRVGKVFGNGIVHLLIIIIVVVVIVIVVVVGKIGERRIGPGLLALGDH